jgi:fermentation-respiration switch protein FrsA (DUF1100 family)
MVPRGLSGLFRLEIQRDAIHAVSKTRGAGPILENVAQVSLTARTMHFGPDHPMTLVRGRLDGVPGRRPEAGPPGPAVEFRVRREERLAAAGTSKDPFTMLLVQRACAGALGPMVSKNQILLRRQRSAPFVFGFQVVHNASVSDSIDSGEVRTAIGFGVIVVVILAVVWVFQRRLIYFPFEEVPDPEAVGLNGAVPVTFPTADGLTLNGWFVSRTETPPLTFIIFNGNAGNRAFRAPLANALVQANLAVLLFDYRGFGGNDGAPTESGLKIDARAAHDFVMQRQTAAQQRPVYFGESLGSAVAAELAVERPPTALILRSPFTSMTDVGQLHYPLLPVRWLLRDRYATVDLIGSVRTPVLVIAGDRDSIVPLSQSRRVFEGAREPKSLLVIRDGDHNDEALLSGREMINGILQFLHALPRTAG